MAEKKGRSFREMLNRSAPMKARQSASDYITGRDAVKAQRGQASAPKKTPAKPIWSTNRKGERVRLNADGTPYK